MEQRLDATYLRSGPFELAGAVGIAAVALGTGVMLAAWGISFLWRYTPPEIAVRIANPELRVSQNGPLVVTQDKPFVLAQPDPLKIQPGELTVKVEQRAPVANGVGADAKTSTGEVIKREVTVFSNVKHGPGTVVTGWNYRDGSGGVPVHQFCYYSAPNADRSSTRIELASNGVRSAIPSASMMPDPDAALAKCQWWQA